MTRWLNVIDDERGTLRIEFYRGLAFLHSTFRKPVVAMRAARAYLPQIKTWLKGMGHEGVLVAIPEGDARLLRFEQAFGFREIFRKNNRIIMWQEC